jgi:hypothetical protein
VPPGSHQRTWAYFDSAGHIRFELNHTLAATYREDREAYTAGKADYIREVMGKARAE